MVLCLALVSSRRSTHANFVYIKKFFCLVGIYTNVLFKLWLEIKHSELKKQREIAAAAKEEEKKKREEQKAAAAARVQAKLDAKKGHGKGKGKAK